MNTPHRTFEDIVLGRTDHLRVYEDEQHLAFLNPTPIRPGHVIVIPKRAYDYLYDMPEAEFQALWGVARALARTMKTRLPCERVCTAVIGWQVRHAHIHLVPTNADGEFPALPGQPAQRDDLERIARQLVHK